ncbi:MAG: hypothetical protein WC264_01255 [Candidatus Paceibacterota bacterium]|jgi:hypothetical protein
MNNKFSSKAHPLMNSFLVYLQQALENLPNNPKPMCEGFYLAYYNPKKNTLITEKIGTVPAEKDFKYLHFACKKVTQTLQKNAIRSKNFENNDLEQYPGAFAIKTPSGTFCAGVSGHESMVDEAISILWLIAKKLISNENKDSNIELFVVSNMFRSLIKYEAYRIQKEFVPDNKWISVIASLIDL